MEIDKKMMAYGDDYYSSNNTVIMQRKKQIFTSEYGIIDDPFLSNHKVPSGFFKKIVDQKVNYLLGNGVEWLEEKGGNEQSEELDNYFEWKFDETLRDLATTASKKAVAWLYMYMDNGTLKFIEVNPEQLEWTYNEVGNLIEMRRRYKEGDQEIMLVYDDVSYTKYVKKADDWDLQYTRGHYSDIKEFNGKIVEEKPLGFGVVPFIPLWNSKDKTSDLQAIKRHIDLYDITMSDFGNNVDDMQDTFFVVKGHPAESAQELLEFVYNLKKSKIASVPEGGDLDTEQLNIPVEARKELLSQLRQDTYSAAMAVDTTELSGGSITNVVIKAMFADLDLKCDLFENQIAKFIYTLINYINRFDNKNFTDSFNLDRSLIINTIETSERLIGEYAVGAMSMKTLRKSLPITLDNEEETKQIKKEEQDRVIRLEPFADGENNEQDN